MPCPHMPMVPTLLKKITPHELAASCAAHKSAPTRTSEPRGSFTTHERNVSNRARKTCARSASGPVPRSGPPATTTRVGSPPVCESMT